VLGVHTIAISAWADELNLARVAQSDKLSTAAHAIGRFGSSFVLRLRLGRMCRGVHLIRRHIRRLVDVS